MTLTPLGYGVLASLSVLAFFGLLWALHRLWVAFRSGRGNVKAVLIAGVALLILFAWTQNTFDNFLWRVHLNHSDCIQNGFGAVFCGSAATKYESRLRDAGIGP